MFSISNRILGNGINILNCCPKCFRSHRNMTMIINFNSMHIFRTQRQALQGLKYGSSYCCMMRTGMRINLSNVIVQLTHTSPSSEPGMFNGPSCLVNLHCLIGPAHFVQHIEAAWLGVKYLYLGHK